MATNQNINCLEKIASISFQSTVKYKNIEKDIYRYIHLFSSYIMCHRVLSLLSLSSEILLNIICRSDFG